MIIFSLMLSPMAYSIIKTTQNEAEVVSEKIRQGERNENDIILYLTYKVRIEIFFEERKYILTKYLCVLSSIVLYCMSYYIRGKTLILVLYINAYLTLLIS